MEFGFVFLDDKALMTAKRNGEAYLKVADGYSKEIIKGLPSPFELSQDPRWSEEGDLYSAYDLKLENKRVFTRVNPVLTWC